MTTSNWILTISNRNILTNLTRKPNIPMIIWVNHMIMEGNYSPINSKLLIDTRIMHYDASSGSIQEGKFTMVPLKKQYILTMGTPIPAFYDKKMMNILYDCMGMHFSYLPSRNHENSELCTQSDHKKCKNGGYAHPRNCAKCVCPGNIFFSEFKYIGLVHKFVTNLLTFLYLTNSNGAFRY